MAQQSIKLPLRETAQLTSIKFPLRETAWTLVGFTISEKIIEWKTASLNLLEMIKSRILLDAELVNKNSIKLKWFGEAVPKLLIFKRFEGENYKSTPDYSVNWNPSEFILPVDKNGIFVKVQGINGTGESNELYFGSSQSYMINPILQLPINEKIYFVEINVNSEYRVEVNL